jgi:hypothetical protein
MKYKHYAPRATVILVRGTDEKYIGFVNRCQKRDGNVAALCYAEDVGRINAPVISLGAEDDLREQAQALFDSLEEMPDVFFFDRCAPGNILLAQLFHEQGVLVYYEPNEPVDRNFLRAVAASDIVKFSDEKHPDVSFTEGHADKLFIQTMNQAGLRFRLRGGEWKHLNPVWNPKAIDGEGAGDWTSSTLIHALGKQGLPSIADLQESILEECLMEAQTVASESVSYMGAKGLIHH